MSKLPLAIPILLMPAICGIAYWYRHSTGTMDSNFWPIVIITVVFWTALCIGGYWCASYEDDQAAKRKAYGLPEPEPPCAHWKLPPIR